MREWIDTVHAWLAEAGASEELAWVLIRVTLLLGILALAVCAFVVARMIVRRLIQAGLRDHGAVIGTAIIESRLISRVAQLSPVLVISLLGPVVFEPGSGWLRALETIAFLYLVLASFLILDALVNAMLLVLQNSPLTRRLPLQGIGQAIKLTGVILCFVLIISHLLGESPVFLFSGLGAMTAVLLLVFREPILGFVAGIQLSANNMVSKGDWIEMPKYGADGDVVEVTLTTVKVQNWDRTLTLIPAYALIQDSFKNWKGMQETGGRRIKRSLYIDTRTIGFLEQEVIEKFKGYGFLRDYIEQKSQEIEAYNKLQVDSKNLKVDGRVLTNLGTFRAYCLAYLRKHPKIRQDLIMLVRQLQPTEHGLPLEIYCFTNDIQWANFEGIQADLFDHFLAVLPEFGLRAFQSPSGHDLLEVGSVLQDKIALTGQARIEAERDTDGRG